MIALLSSSIILFPITFITTVLISKKVLIRQEPVERMVPDHDLNALNDPIAFFITLCLHPKSNKLDK
jgi:hypothetical protein